MLRSVNKAMTAVARSTTTAAGSARSWQALAMVDASLSSPSNSMVVGGRRASRLGVER